MNTVIEFKIKLEKEISEEKEINYKIVIKMLDIVKLFCFK